MNRGQALKVWQRTYGDLPATAEEPRAPREPPEGLERAREWLEAHRGDATGMASGAVKLHAYRQEKTWMGDLAALGVQGDPRPVLGALAVEMKGVLLRDKAGLRYLLVA
ncbi:MAG: hypothetical protein HY558_06065 [Euryarchaeota archaeon]|nr:hypothetical protein [Euryarchaeota archaeon]